MIFTQGVNSDGFVDGSGTFGYAIENGTIVQGKNGATVFVLWRNELISFINDKENYLPPPFDADVAPPIPTTLPPAIPTTPPPNMLQSILNSNDHEIAVLNKHYLRLTQETHLEDATYTLEVEKIKYDADLSDIKLQPYVQPYEAAAKVPNVSLNSSKSGTNEEVVGEKNADALKGSNHKSEIPKLPNQAPQPCSSINGQQNLEKRKSQVSSSESDKTTNKNGEMLAQASEYLSEKNIKRHSIFTIRLC